MDSLDFERFGESFRVTGFSIEESMHHYRPRPPCDSKGEPFPIPRRMASVFAFHCGAWAESASGVVSAAVARRAAPVRPFRFDVSQGGFSNRMPGQLAELRAKLLEPTHAPVFEPWTDEEKQDPFWADLVRANPQGMSSPFVEIEHEN
jgi:hypothetical protein